MRTVIKEYTMSIALAVIFIAAVIVTGGRMLYPQNLSNLLTQNAYVLILAGGMLMCILSGGNIDLSVGAVACLVGAVCARILETGLGFLPALAAGLGLSLVIGLWNGFWIGKIRIPSFVATLSGMFLFRGLARAILNSRTVAVTDEGFLNIFFSYISIPGLDDGPVKLSCILLGIILSVVTMVITVRKLHGRKEILSGAHLARKEIVKTAVICILILAYTGMIAGYKGIPVMAVWVAVILIVFHFVAANTPVGRHIYAVGENEKTAALSGINSSRILFFTFTAMALLSGICGMMALSRIGSVNGDLGNAFEMDAIAACFIGGASPRGGSGTISGIVVGAALLGVINQGMSIMGLDSNWQYVVKGLILLGAVVADVAMNSRK